MSGGHFDCQQYHIEDIANSIEKEIEEAAKPKPPKVWKEGVSVLKEWKDGYLSSSGFNFSNYDETKSYFSENALYDFLDEHTDSNGCRIALYKTKFDTKYIIREARWQEYEDGEYYTEYTEETLRIFKDAVKILRKAAVYAQRIDWFLSGDDGEDTLKERLEEELKKLEE